MARGRRCVSAEGRARARGGREGARVSGPNNRVVDTKAPYLSLVEG